MKMHIALLIVIMSLTACQKTTKTSPLSRGDWTLPFGDWKFAFFTPYALPALVTHVRLIDTAGYLYHFFDLDPTRDDHMTREAWSRTTRSASLRFNHASFPPQYMVFCWDSIIDMKVYETSIFFPRSVWEKMRTPASYKARSGATVWYSTMLFGLAPEGKVRVWLQDVGEHPNYLIPGLKMKTVSGDQLDICRDITKHPNGYKYYGDTPAFIKGKTYPYGEW